ncbi:hypothetical protein RUM43_009785 [Polyplax serrata]|uniref:Uncharacterized protein n=1 Tax=Polyplax serrata TaxID=468196 RepID=A0AAN8S7N9_POLSC
MDGTDRNGLPSLNQPRDLADKVLEEQSSEVGSYRWGLRAQGRGCDKQTNRVWGRMQTQGESKEMTMIFGCQVRGIQQTREAALEAGVPSLRDPIVELI